MKTSYPWEAGTQSLNSFQKILNSASERDMYTYAIYFNIFLNICIGNVVNYKPEGILAAELRGTAR